MGEVFNKRHQVIAESSILASAQSGSSSEAGKSVCPAHARANTGEHLHAGGQRAPSG